jgi:hypothetical protein
MLLSFRQAFFYLFTPAFTPDNLLAVDPGHLSE